MERRRGKLFLGFVMLIVVCGNQAYVFEFAYKEGMVSHGL